MHPERNRKVREDRCAFEDSQVPPAGRPLLRRGRPWRTIFNHSWLEANGDVEVVVDGVEGRLPQKATDHVHKLRQKL